MHRHALKRKQAAECIRAALCAQDHEKAKVKDDPRMHLQFKSETESKRERERGPTDRSESCLSFYSAFCLLCVGQCDQKWLKRPLISSGSYTFSSFLYSTAYKQILLWRNIKSLTETRYKPLNPLYHPWMHLKAKHHQMDQY